MKKHGILNSHISHVLSDMGHTDTITIADAGLPIPSDVQRIDLALTPGVPSFISVLDAVLADMTVEKVIIASEMKTDNPSLYSYIQDTFKDTKIETVSHQAFKMQTYASKAIIRTGEMHPFANIILVSGVDFTGGE